MKKITCHSTCVVDVWRYKRGWCRGFVLSGEFSWYLISHLGNLGYISKVCFCAFFRVMPFFVTERKLQIPKAIGLIKQT